MSRNTAILAVLVTAGLIVAAPFVLEVPERSRDEERAGSRDPDREIHVPRGFADSEFLPPTAPVPWDAEEDRGTRPYHLLVQLLRFSDLSLYEGVEAHQVEVLGARAITRIGPGRFLCSDIDLALTSIRVLDSDQMASARGPGGTQTSLALRTTVAMARNAVTVASVIVIENTDLDTEFQGKGVVTDRFTGEPLPGVVIKTPTDIGEISDTEGRFEFDEPLTVRNLLGLSVYTDGYWRFNANLGCLTRAWLQHWYDTGEMVFTLRQSKEHRIYRPLRNVDE